jgi:hypothetical protein
MHPVKCLKHRLSIIVAHCPLIGRVTVDRLYKIRVIWSKERGQKSKNQDLPDAGRKGNSRFLAAKEDVRSQDPPVQIRRVGTHSVLQSISFQSSAGVDKNTFVNNGHNFLRDNEFDSTPTIPLVATEWIQSPYWTWNRKWNHSRQCWRPSRWKIARCPRRPLRTRREATERKLWSNWSRKVRVKIKAREELRTFVWFV